MDADGYRRSRAPPVFDENAAELKLGPEFQDARCLMYSEVAILLEFSQDADAEVPEMVQKTLDYVKRFSRFDSQTAVREARKTLERNQLHQFEVATVGNLCPAEAEEAKALVPSLEGRFADSDIQDMLVDLSRFRTA
mmetsp:Transcript_25148/g.63248  ORF Transcript_25148/g.63248 Transcript_25148/m.63248 type:complete len:137 (+) Transcript_25148:54-464(+)|eukprot:CAMPEP_0177649278 /NCGR_PEP_ID=MMETSP0447-20121125/11294_1 /TAXON_ID=0 /ORGANISM="Stygamoeba regulata, Strain BSH-02190019" /LENGTH=136 /DNA_ID=CAMNT_0019152011 /DNA_START=54 /DNA_END=464 /DNA_ORIENTATION=+